MATANLNNELLEIASANDSIVIIDNFQSIRGGRTLDVTGFNDPVIKAGHVIIKSATGVYKPMPITGDGSYASLPANHTYAGVLIASIPTNRAFAGIMVRGTVNTKATPFDMATILDAFRGTLPLIDFRNADRMSYED